MPLAMFILSAMSAEIYINLYKFIPILIVLLAWARLLTWIDKDAVAAHLPREWLNLTVFGSGLLGFLLCFLLPGYLIGVTAMLVLTLAGVGVYLGMRHRTVGLGDLSKEFAGFTSSFTQKKGPKTASAGEVTIVDRQGRALPPPLDDESAERATYDALQNLLADPLKKNAEAIEIKPEGEDGAAVSIMVDGVRYNAPTMSRTLAAGCIAQLKQAAGMDLNDKRKPQQGKIKATLAGKHRVLQVLTAGTTHGESMRLEVDAQNRYTMKIDDLGFQPDQLATFKSNIGEGGIVLLAAPTGQGLTTLMYAAVRAHDAFLSHIQTIERAPRQDLEGVTQNTLSSAAPAEQAKQVEWVISQEPDVILVDQILSPAVARSLCAFARDNRRAYVGMRVNSTFEAVALWRKIVGDDEMALRPLRMAITGRVLRRLCVACKVSYAPDPNMLRKLNLDPNVVTKLHQARSSPMRDPKGNLIPCQFCQELRFKGRFGVYEVLTLEDELRQAFAANAASNQLKVLYRKQRGLFLQESALLHVQSGDTSVQEVLRVLRGGEESAAGGPMPTTVVAGRA